MCIIVFMESEKMNKDKLISNSIKLLSKAIISSMPKSYFKSPDAANKYMLKGDEKFSDKAGSFFTCGFAKNILTPENITKTNYYIAGYDSNNPAKGVLDDMFARAVYIDDNTGRGGVVFCVLDAVGISRKDINDIRRIVIESKKIPSLKSINISATHSHSAVDTQGLWGEKLFKSGKNDAFMAKLKKKTADAIISAYENRKNGKIYFAKKETVDMQFDCRTPDTYDKNLTRIRFIADDDSEIYIVNFASHAELLGSETKVISADFPAYMIKEIEENKSNTEVVFINGAIGGMISAKEIKKVYREEIDCEKYTKEFGRTLGRLVLSLNNETELEPIINIKSKPVEIKAENFVLILARLLKVLNNDIARNNKRSEASIYSEVGYMELGLNKIGAFLIPGELFPELWNGEFLTAEESANAVEADYKVLSEMCNCEHQFVIGLCNDELGYIIPENDFILNQRLPYINAAKDRFDRNHYEETNSTGSKTAFTLLNETDKLIASAK